MVYRRRRRRGRIGPPQKCVCVMCGHEVEHERGERCSQKKCPKCGGKMIGKWESQD